MLSTSDRRLGLSRQRHTAAVRPSLLPQCNIVTIFRHQHLFPAYSSAIFDWMNFSSSSSSNGSGSGSSSSAEGIGVSLVDGRFRVACAAAAGSQKRFPHCIIVTVCCSPRTARWFPCTSARLHQARALRCHGAVFEACWGGG